ncbi:MAG: tRNA (cytidine(34)-2'-O)-methyltransferase [Mesorhizobium sp.]|nr:tRNA (cytidine(34)-2'-O)-methyltransferase [Mesorhizobium sp.]
MDAGKPQEPTGQPLGCDLRIALYQPDIAGNTGAILRLGACMGTGIEVIGPAGFDMSDRTLKRAGMDYVAMAGLTRHVDWSAFRVWQQREQRRLVLFTTRAGTELWDFAFRPDDVLLFGRESAGVPDTVHETADAAVVIPMPGGGRSLNLAMSAAMAAGEAMRQLSPRHGSPA